MWVLVSLAAVAVLFLMGYTAAALGLQSFVGIVVPYAAISVFLIGLVCRVVGWAKSPVPFRITTTCGQQKSLPWLKRARFDNPSTPLETIGRMLLEILLFRSLFRNTKMQLFEGRRLVYGTDLLLWAGAMLFHWSLLVVILRHVRFFTEPAPFWVALLQRLDGIMQVGLPVVFYMSSCVLLVALAYLLWRRLAIPQLRYISLPNDYFPLFLLLGIALSGVCLRYLFKTDIVGVKELALGLVTFSPTVPEGISPLFFGHFFLSSVLLTYFPFSKLMHLAGVFLSPTRNLANNNRMVRHINPWDYPVKVHTYEEYEDEFRDVMKEAGVPVEKE